MSCIGVTGLVADHVRWMRIEAYSPNTIKLRLLALQLLERYAGQDLADLTEADLDAWQGTLLVLADATRAAYALQVKQFYRWAYQHGRLPADPSEVLKCPKVRKGQPRPISEPDLRKALGEVPQVVRVWFCLAAFCGLRASEIAGLRREDVIEYGDLPRLMVRGKGGKERTVPIPPNPLAELLAYGLPRRGPLFLRSESLPVTGRYVSGTCNRWLHRIGVKDSLHKLRHRYATQVLDHGAHIRDLQELLGHETLAATAVYTRVLPRRAAPVVAAVDHPLI